MFKLTTRLCSTLTKPKKASFYGNIRMQLNAIKSKPEVEIPFKLKSIDDPRYVPDDKSLQNVRTRRYNDFKSRVLKPPTTRPNHFSIKVTNHLLELKKNCITLENLKEKAKYASTHVVNYNFAIDRNGNTKSTLKTKDGKFIKILPDI